MRFDLNETKNENMVVNMKDNAKFVSNALGAIEVPLAQKFAIDIDTETNNDEIKAIPIIWSILGSSNI
jgi:uncharacterized membrane protein